MLLKRISRRGAAAQRKDAKLSASAPLRDLFFFVIVFFASISNAQEGQVVEFIYPQCGQAGTTVKVIAQGHFLQDPREVVFYQPGIRCTKLEPIDSTLNIITGQRAKADLGRSVQLTFEIAKDAKPGEYQLRLRTRDNLSEMVTFWVTPFPVVAEKHAWADVNDTRNDSPEYAQPIPLNSTVFGYLPSNLPQDHDYFSVDCKKGQRLSVEVVAARLGTLHYGGMNDPAIKVFDAAGKEIARNDDNALFTQDPVVTVVIPADGTYYIDMHQQMDYEAARLRHYLMHVGTFARPMIAFPLGGQAGENVSLSLLGDATGVLKTNLTLPSTIGEFEKATLPVGWDSDPVPQPGTRADGIGVPSYSPSPNKIHVAPFPSVNENKGAESPQIITQPLPIAIDGRIESEGEVDWYRITAKKGERFRVFTYAKTLDSELDARVWIRPAPDNPSKKSYDEDDSRWEPHDLVGHHYRHQTKIRLDPVFMFEPDTDGDWLVGIGDTRREFGPHHIYHVEFQPHVDSAFVHFPAYPSTPTIIRDRIVLYPGQNYARPVTVQTGFGSQNDGLLQLRATNLPDGVTMDCRPFKQDAGIIPVLFHATKEANIGAKLIDLVVEPVDPAARENFRGGFIQNNQATNRRGDYAMYFNRTRKMALAVVEGATFDLEVEQPSVPLVRNGELSLTVKVHRREGFEGAVYCEADWLPPSVNKQPPLIIAAGETQGTYKLSASGSAATGEFPISITGRENEGGNVRTAAGFHFVCSPFVQLSVGEPFVTLRLARSAISRNTVGKITATIDHHKPFSGEAELRLGRLPFGVKQVGPIPKIKADDRQVTFQVEVTRDCLVGQYKDIYCEVSVSVANQIIRQQTGNGVLRVDPERSGN